MSSDIRKCRVTWEPLKRGGFWVTHGCSASYEGCEGEAVVACRCKPRNDEATTHYLCGNCASKVKQYLKRGI